jgi:alpha-amylase/alpha-mannosidase (GH57 family)
MPVLRLVVLWHQHQPFYKDLVTGEYRLPWVRMHALKDYYGMVKLLDEFPQVHQTFNIVPSLVTQIEDYVRGTAIDPFLQVATKPAGDLSEAERWFALQYLFQAHPVNLIGRYGRYRELWERFRSHGSSPQRAERHFQTGDLTDLQVLSQIAWFDEFVLAEPDLERLIQKGRDYSTEDQSLVVARGRELIAQVLPAHAAAAQRGAVELSTSPFYHPILPLLCDTNQGGVSSPGLPLPQARFRRPEDASEQLLRGLDLHQKVFGIRPQGVWPSEGSISEEVFTIAHRLGVKWMASDEGVLGRTFKISYERDGEGRLSDQAAERLYTVHRYETSEAQMYLLFRDHAISDLIGFVYSGMAPQDAAHHLLERVRQAAKPLLDKGSDAVVSIILDGENAWEYYRQSGREFLRRFYDLIGQTPEIEAVTVSEAIERQRRPVSSIASGELVPGSWINANFNVWIGAPEDNRSWDYLHHAREFYRTHSSQATEEQRKLAFEELLIAEGSDWNWWYGPEHSSANDRDFDELYRKHLSNVYQALGAVPPDHLAHPISTDAAAAKFTPQTHYIHPDVTGERIRYFEWMGAAVYTAERRAGAMHGKRFVLDAIYSGIDETNVYGRLDFAGEAFEADFDLVVNLESWSPSADRARRALRLNAKIEQRRLVSWNLSTLEEDPIASRQDPQAVIAVLGRSFEFKIPLALLLATPVASTAARQADSSSELLATRLRLRISLWQNSLPVDALPAEGWIELQLASEQDLATNL